MPVLGIIGGGQLGSMMCEAAKKLSVETIILSDDKNAPAQNFCDQFNCVCNIKLNRFCSQHDQNKWFKFKMS